MIKHILSSQCIHEVKQFIENSGRVAIVTHVSPDGDAVGSSLALYHFLRGKGKEVHVVVPNSFPQFLKWLPGAEHIIRYDSRPEVSQSILESADLIFCLDFNTLSRIKELGGIVRSSVAHKVMIDHHLYPEQFANVTISHPEISSTSELIFRLIYDLGEYPLLSYDIAEAIYTGMMTDTGAFSYNSNNPDIYIIISCLISQGIDKDQIYRNVYHNYSEQRFRMMGYMLSEKMKLYSEQQTALLWLTNEEQERFQSAKGDTEGFVNIPLSIKGIVFSVMFREDGGMIKLSFRSVGSFPANEFASTYFSGGGHLNAAGGEYYGSLEEALNLFDKVLPEFYEQNKRRIESQQ